MSIILGRVMSTKKWIAVFSLIFLAVIITAAAKGQKQESQKSAVFSGKIPLRPKDLEQFTWRHIGPWPFSGRITNFAVPPEQSQVYYVLTATGGLWKTEDGGIHFEPIFEKYGNQSLGYLAIAPSNPNILYLGTGEPIHSRVAYHGNGVWKSTDGGKSWKKLTAGLPDLEKMKTGRNGLAIYPKNPNIVYLRLDEEVNLGLSERVGAALYNQRSLFRDGFYFNINSRIIKSTQPSLNTLISLILN